MHCRERRRCYGHFNMMRGDSFDTMYGEWFSYAHVVFFYGGCNYGWGTGGPRGNYVYGE